MERAKSIGEPRLAVVYLFAYSRRAGMEVDAAGVVYTGRGGGQVAGRVDAASGAVYRARGRLGEALCGTVDEEGVVSVLETWGFWFRRRREPLPVLEIGSDGGIYDLTNVNRRPQVGAVEGRASPELVGGAALLLWLEHRKQRPPINAGFWEGVVNSQRGVR